eukprot:TRINITY_DN174701_c0_g3_i1.p1 TRINITY_DN174701_c0_g3~~TRINITY_DN174701_c0_g3_i1.p1  ORF type:complete len:1188 (+),score=443.97 TRINITY_DN174701_c0_g3_i1:122-3685(+)
MAENSDKVPLSVDKSHFDSQLYGDDRSNLNKELYDPEELDAESQSHQMDMELPSRDDHTDYEMELREKHGSGLVDDRIHKSDSQYVRQGKLRNLMQTPARSGDVYAGETPARSYGETLREGKLRNEEHRIHEAIRKKREAEKEAEGEDKVSPPQKRSRTGDEVKTPKKSEILETPKASASDMATPKKPGRWDIQTPAQTPAGRWDQTPAQTPQASAFATPGRAQNRWDQTPAQTPALGAATPGMFGQTPATPMTPYTMPATPGVAGIKHMDDISIRNMPWTEEVLDQVLPAEGYEIIKAPEDYRPQTKPHLFSAPTPGVTPGFQVGQTPMPVEAYGYMPTPSAQDLPMLNNSDIPKFGCLLEEVDEEKLTPAEAKQRKILTLLLKIKNGTPPQRKSALKQITNKAREFGAKALFDELLSLLNVPSLEHQERHLLVKVVDRVLYKLDDLVRPYVRKILAIVEPMLIEEDYFARVEAREIISNLAKAAGLATMIAQMRNDIDDPDEYVRNTTARAFSVIASALGIPAIMPFLKAVCQSKKSWYARHTGIKIVQQIAILMGCAVLPHLKSLIGNIAHGLTDDNQKVRTITALALAALAEASHPYGIESFDPVVRPLYKGLRMHRGKVLAAFLKCTGCVISLMQSNHSMYFAKEAMKVVIREFETPDEEMKRIVLKVVKQIVATEGVEVSYIRQEVLPDFFRCFWVRRTAMDRVYKPCVETTVELATKVGATEIISRVVDDLKDENERYRRMVMETIDTIIQNVGAHAVMDARLEERLIDGIMYAFQEQTVDDKDVLLNGFATVVNAMGKRVKSYLKQIAATVLWRFQNKAVRIRMQAADLIARIAFVMKQCEEENLLAHFGVVLYECLGEEYPEVLGSILGALKAIVNVIGMHHMQPPIKELLPRLTPILKNRHEKVQENCIDLVGRIADRGAEHVSGNEWMRICFDLLDLLNARKKAIRRATVNTFGYIAKAVGPEDVLHTLLNNLKVQERQNRVCTTVAIAIVAETCAPFAVIPALMNEYRVPEMNVQNGVLKAFSFMFEYIGPMGRDYIYSVTPLLEDALMDRDPVHRQTASAVVKHVGLGVHGLGCEDALAHLLNFIWPNIFETSPHVMNAVFEAIEACRVSLGSHAIANHVWQGLWHPARRVREVYWKLYNNLYVYSQDELNTCYPRIPDDENNSFVKTFDELFI